MEKALKPLVSASEILKFSTRSNIIIVDARGGSDSYDRFKRAHIEGACYVDLDLDLSANTIDPSQGGRHPLPDIRSFCELLGRLGITPETHVVVYDDKNGANAAARFWWMLKALGHPAVQVLNGGLAAAEREGLPITDFLSLSISTSPYPASEWMMPRADLVKVIQAAADPLSLVIDVREAYRFNGEREPIDKVAGHIPGARNIPYLENLDERGEFLSPDLLRIKYGTAIGNREMNHVIVHCGSGVTACHTLLALEHAGISGASLYVGSWSEWSRRDLPVATEDIKK